MVCAAIRVVGMHQRVPVVVAILQEFLRQKAIALDEEHLQIYCMQYQQLVNAETEVDLISKKVRV